MPATSISQTKNVCLVLNKNINERDYWDSVGVHLWTDLLKTQNCNGYYGSSSGANLVFMCGGDKRLVVCHDPVLKQCSPFLKEVLNEINFQNCCERTIVFPDTTSDILLHCLLLIYKGETDINETELMDVMELFYMLKIRFKLRQNDNGLQCNKNSL